MFLRFTPQEKRLFLFVIATFLLGSVIRYGHHLRTTHVAVQLDSLDRVFLARADSIEKTGNVRYADPAEVHMDTVKLNINKATIQELQALPGIGPVLAGRIVDARADSAFRQVESVLRVNGIGPKLFASIHDRICIE